MTAAPPPSLRANLRALPPAAWVLFAGTFVNRFGTFVMPFLVLYLTGMHYSIAKAGLAVGVYGSGHLVSSLVGGHLADRFGRRNTIALSMFGSAAAMVALSQARGYWPIVGVTFVAGLLSELYRPASHALIADLVPAEQRITAYGMYRLAVNLGFAIGPAVGGFMASRSYVYLFLGDALTSSGYGVIALLFLPHGVRSIAIAGERASEGLRVALRDRRFMHFLFATVCVTWVDFQMGTTFALHVRNQGHSSGTYGLLLSINGGMIVCLELAITSWTQRIKAQKAIAIGYFLGAFGFALTGFAHSIVALGATVVVWTIGEMIASPVAGAYAANLAPERYRGRYMGLFVMAWSIGMVIGPTVGTLLFARNPTMLWIACGVSAFVAVGFALATPRERGEIARA